MPGGGFGILCSRGRRPRAKCRACKKIVGEFLCDHPTGDPCKTCERRRAASLDFANCEDCDGTGLATCSLLICRRCRHRTADDRDLCPAHTPAEEKGPVMRKCKLCDRDLVFVRSADSGKVIPLDANSITYTLEERDGETRAVRSSALVTHFQTCPEANQFGSRRKAAPPPQQPALLETAPAHRDDA